MNVGIIGSGTMGSGIAAHLCNANIPVTLLDLTTEISQKAKERIQKSRPPLLIDKSKINGINIDYIKLKSAVNLNNFTLKSQEVVQKAQELTQKFSHQQIENEHLFKALMEVDNNVLPFVFKKLLGSNVS